MSSKHCFVMARERVTGPPYVDIQCIIDNTLACYYIHCLCLCIIIDVDGLAAHKNWPQWQSRLSIHDNCCYFGPRYLACVKLCWTAYVCKSIDLKTTNPCLWNARCFNAVYCDLFLSSLTIHYDKNEGNIWKVHSRLLISIYSIRVQPWFNL